MTYPAFCPYPDCTMHDNPTTGFFIKKGYYKTKHNHQPVPRYYCKECERYFSTSSFKETAHQHKPEINEPLFRLLVSGVSQRRAAKIVGCSKRTVDKKLKYLAKQAAQQHDIAIAEKQFETSCVQVDEMETYEHTRCKPLSIAMAVRHKTGEILGMEVAKMPAKGLLAKIGKTKYKWTTDERERAFKKLMRRISPCIKPTITFKSDSHKSYKGWITSIFPHAVHEKHKRIKTPKGSPKPFDPLFKVNNTCAKMRNDIARLARKKWVTTKSEDSLQNHLWLYIAWTNGYQIK